MKTTESTLGILTDDFWDDTILLVLPDSPEDERTETKVMNKKIMFSCECGRVTAVDHRFAGCKGRCRRCQAVIRVPNTLPRAHDPRPRRREDRISRRLQRRSHSFRLLGQVLVVLVLGTLVGAVVGGVTLL